MALFPAALAFWRMSRQSSTTGSRKGWNWARGNDQRGLGNAETRAAHLSRVDEQSLALNVAAESRAEGSATSSP